MTSAGSLGWGAAQPPTPWGERGPWVMSEAEQQAIRAKLAEFQAPTAPASPPVRLAPGEAERVAQAVLALTSSKETAMAETSALEPRPLGCPACQACGFWHCSDPLRCGGMRWEDAAQAVLALLCDLVGPAPSYHNDLC